MLSPSSNPVLFSGQEDYTLDDKGRVTVPRNWRRPGVETETFHLVPDSQELCLRAMSPERFTRFGEEARLQPGMDDKKHRLFMRHFYANSTEVTTDKQGRISVPKEYCERLKLRGGIRLGGLRRSLRALEQGEARSQHRSGGFAIQPFCRCPGLMIAALDYPSPWNGTLSPRKRLTAMPHPNRSYEYHESVLLAETLERLAPGPGAVILDGTLGGGGHTAAILAGRRARHRARPGCGGDRSRRARGSRIVNDRFRAVRSSFADVARMRSMTSVSAQIDGALLDLGVSSHQLDAAARGFSFMRDGPLDMRMDQRAPITAADLVNTMAAEQLERIFRQYGEEPAARRNRRPHRARSAGAIHHHHARRSPRSWNPSCLAAAARIRRRAFSRRSASR